MMPTRTKCLLIFFLVIISFTSRNVFSQTVEEIYLQLPDKYIYSPLSHIATTYENGAGKIIDKKMLKKLLSMDLSEINQMASDLQRSKLEVKIVDDKNNYIQFCDVGCAWEFTMKVFNNEKGKPTYVAIFEGNDDGATSGTNKVFHFFEIIKNKDAFIFKDVTDDFQPIITYKQVIDPNLYKKYKFSIDKWFQKEDENLLDYFTLNQYNSVLAGYVDHTGILFMDTYYSLPEEVKIIADSMYNKKIEFKWDGKKFKRLNLNYLIQ